MELFERQREPERASKNSLLVIAQIFKRHTGLKKYNLERQTDIKKKPKKL